MKDGWMNRGREGGKEGRKNRCREGRKVKKGKTKWIETQNEGWNEIHVRDYKTNY